MPKRDDFTAGYDRIDQSDGQEITFASAFGMNLPAGVLSDSALQTLRWSMTGVVIDRELSEDEWFSLIQDIRKIKRAYLWMLADLMVYGIARGYGTTAAKYEALAKATGYTKESLQTFATVARSVEISRRLENLSFSHHQEVAPLSPDEQTEWLGSAKANHWSAKRLRAEIAQSKLLPEPSDIAGTIALPDGVTMEPTPPPDKLVEMEEEAVALPSPVTDDINKKRFQYVWKKVIHNDLTMDDRQDVILLRLWCDQVLQNMKHSGK